MTFLRTYWLLLPVLFIPYLYGEALLNLLERWLTETEYSHGIVIPFISAYIVIERWQAIQASASRGSLWGLWVVGVALLLFLVGEISALYALIQISFVLLLWGGSLALVGWRSTGLLSAPIFILFFAIPLPYFFEVLLTAQLQLLSSKLGVLFIGWLGIPVFLSGNVIDLGRHQLEVVEACSGLRFLYPLMSVGFIAAYFYRTHWFKRGFIFLSTIPITVVMNSLRIAITAVLVEKYGLAAAEGTVHDAEGWVVFALCLVFLLLEIIVLERLTSRRSIFDILGLDDTVSAVRPGGAALKSPAHKHKTVYGAMTLLLLTFFVSTFLDRRQETEAPVTHLALFPQTIGPWLGEPQPLDARVANKLKLSDYLMMNFKQPNLVEPINLYVAYYANQRKGESPHSPRVCMPGGGWVIESFERVVLDGANVNRAVIAKEGQKQLVYYWFSERGETVANEYFKKWLLFKAFVQTGRTDGALVRVTIPVLNNIQLAESDKKIKAFIALIRSPLATFLPGSDSY